jgi:hypothetical protein
MFFDHKTKKGVKPQDGWEGQETVNWSTTEGYDAVRQVNNGLRWPSVWADRKAKAVRDKAAKKVSSLTSQKAASHKKLIEVEKPVVVLATQASAEIARPVEVAKPTSHKVENKPHSQSASFWQRWFVGRPSGQARRFNKTRSRQIKQKSGGLSLGAAQVSPASFRAKEDRRRQLFEARRAAQPAPAPKQPEKKIIQPEPVDSPKPQTQPVGTNQENNNNQQRFQDLKQKFEQKAWNRPSLTETNLVDSRATLYFNWNKFWLVLTQWLVVTLFFLSLCGALLYLWQQRQSKQAADVTQRFTKIDQLINLTENEVGGVLDFRLRLIMVNEMLSKHIYWNNFFSFLEKNTLPNVFYQDFSGDTKGDYILRAKTDSFDSMAKQIKVFRLSPDVIEASSEGGEMVKNEPAADASSTDEIITGSQLNFSIRLKIKPGLFSK